MDSLDEAPAALPVSAAIVANCAICKKSIVGGTRGWAGHIRGKMHRSQVANNPQDTALQYNPDVHTLQGASSDPFDLQLTFNCVPCGDAVPLTEWEKHLKSRKHLWKAESTMCSPCNRLILRRDWASHSRSKAHLAAAPSTSTSQSHDPPAPPVSLPQTVFCTDCDTTVLSTDWQAHEQSDAHQFNAAQIPSSGLYDPDAISDTDGLDLPAGIPEPSSLQKPNQAQKTPKAVYDRVLLVPTRKGRRAIIPGVPPTHINIIPWKQKLAPYLIPKEIRDIFRSQTPRFDAELELVRNKASSTSASRAYARSWGALIFVEEIQIRHGLTRFDIRDVPLVQRGLFYELLDPRVMGQHALHIGDTVAVKYQNSQGKSSKRAPLEGYVHYIGDYGVGLRLHSHFQAQPDQIFDIELQLNRTMIQRMQDALVIPLKQVDRKRLLFPQPEFFAAIPSIPSSATKELKRQIVNNLIKYNPQQLLAVCAIKDKPFGSPPLIVLGASGTGKTSTLVEATRQVLFQIPDARILICTPSDSGADFIAQNLVDLGSSALFRLNAPTRPVRSLPPNLLPFTTLAERDGIYPVDTLVNQYAKPLEMFSCPTKDVLMEFRVVVSTCAQGGIPGGIGVPRGHFTHILIDDAGQILEPEIMIPIRTMPTAETNLILFGDHKQMGPIVHSPIAKHLGYGVSYLERLMSMPPYSYGSNPPDSCVVRLAWNYRTHPTILKFPSDEFYQGQLLGHGKPDIINIAQSSRGLFEKSFPIIFHAVKGDNLQEGSYMSYVNREEATVAMEYITKLRSMGLPASDVGVIAPYEAQCREIRGLVRVSDSASGGCKIGRVEEFQGQDRAAVIISTVRSDPRLVAKFDRMYGLGLVGQPQRFNVAITRARALLIIVGNPSVLGLDPVWRAFLNYILFNGGWRGAGVEDDLGVIQSDSSLDEVLDVFAGDQDIEYPAVVDIPWKGDHE